MSLNYASLTNDINVFDNFASVPVPVPVPQVIETMEAEDGEVEGNSSNETIGAPLVTAESAESETVTAESETAVTAESEESETVVPAESETVGAPVTVTTEEESIIQEEEDMGMSKLTETKSTTFRPTKSWNAVFSLFDLKRDGKLDKYEAMLLLACVLDRDITSITESQLLANNNLLKVNLEDIKRAEFVAACNQLKTPQNTKLSSTVAYYAFQPKRAKYHNPLIAKKLEKSIVVPEIQEEEDQETGGGMSMYNIILIILIVLLLSSLMSKE